MFDFYNIISYRPLLYQQSYYLLFLLIVHLRAQGHVVEPVPTARGTPENVETTSSDFEIYNGGTLTSPDL